MLDQLRASQAWQEIGSDVNATSADGCPSRRDSTPEPPLPVAELESPPSVSNHISSLLSRLQSGVSASFPPDDPSNAHVRNGAHQDLPSSTKAHDSRHNANPTVHHSSAQKSSVRNLSYIQALPVVARLAEDPAFIKSLEKVIVFYVVPVAV